MPGMCAAGREEGVMTRHLQIVDDQPIRTARIHHVQPAEDGHQLAARAVERAVRVVAGIRDEGPYTVAEVTDTLQRQELVALVTALAAMVPADVDPGQALAWIESQASEWPASVLAGEARRYDDGARDATALLAIKESDRRLTAHLHHPAAEGRSA